MLAANIISQFSEQISYQDNYGGRLIEIIGSEDFLGSTTITWLSFDI